MGLAAFQSFHGDLQGVVVEPRPALAINQIELGNPVN
jgi:hypothetical protein